MGASILLQQCQPANGTSPLAAGFLTGKLTRGEDIKGSRFDPDNPIGHAYRATYDKVALHDGVRMLDGLATKEGISLAEAALRWEYYHSALSDQDGIVLGVSQASHLQSSVAAISKGELPEHLVKGFEEVWDEIRRSQRS